MKERIVEYLSCPECNNDLRLKATSLSNGEVKEGYLICKGCNKEYPITNFIPRFVPKKSYVESFGLEWSMHSRTAVDKFNGTHISHDRFYDTTNWDKDLRGQKILEVGCGSGRFTEVALEAGAEVFSFDYSSAVDSNLANNNSENLHLFQADLYKIPLKKGMFDKIFCLGVLQHCPDVRGAFMSMVPYLKENGEIVIDVYKKTLKSYFVPRYYLRTITKRMNHEQLYKICRKWVPVMLPIKRKLKKVPLFGLVHIFIPVANYFDNLKLDDEQMIEWSILDTFDILSPKYDQPQTKSDVINWFTETGLKDVVVRVGGNGIIGKGVRKSCR